MADNKLLSDLLQDINSATDEKEKYELIQFLLKWVNRNDLVNVAINSMSKGDTKQASTLKKYELVVGDIEIEM